MVNDGFRNPAGQRLACASNLDAAGDTVAVSCPFCLQMFDEGISAKGLEGKKQAKDLIELVDEAMPEPAAPAQAGT